MRILAYVLTTLLVIIACGRYQPQAPYTPGQGKGDGSSLPGGQGPDQTPTSGADVSLEPPAGEVTQIPVEPAGPTTVPTVPPTITPTITPTPTLCTYKAYVDVSVPKSQYKVGEDIIVTATLFNIDDCSIGLPIFRFGGSQFGKVFGQETVQTESFYKGLYKGESFTITKTIKPVAPGQVDLWGGASFEVNTHYLGDEPPYQEISHFWAWSNQAGKSAIIDVFPAETDDICYWDGHVDITSAQTSVKIGDEVTFTATLKNSGCSEIRNPKYFVSFDNDKVFGRKNITIVGDNASAQPNGSIVKTFTMKAKGQGAANVSALATFEAGTYPKGKPSDISWMQGFTTKVGAATVIDVKVQK